MSMSCGGGSRRSTPVALTREPGEVERVATRLGVIPLGGIDR